jgi:hypothetical protein
METLNNKELDAAIEKQAIERNAKKASKITGNRIWDIATRNNLKPKVIRLKKMY